MALTIVTGMWGPRRQQYADGFFSGFAKNWPKSVSLHIYTDGKITGAPVGSTIMLLDGCPGYMDFMARNRTDPERCGRQPNEQWKPKAVAEGYNFRFDAVRFAGQAFAPHRSARMLPTGDVLCWLDADVVTRSPVPDGWVERLIGASAGAYLGRGAKHSEIGFWAVRLSLSTRDMISAFHDLYTSQRLFELSEWHSAFAWDVARSETIDRAGKQPLRNLTPGGSGHVFAASPLAQYLEHRKGARKGFIT